MKYGDVVMPARKWFWAVEGGWTSRPWKKGECGEKHDKILHELDPGPKVMPEEYYELFDMEHMGQYLGYDLYGWHGWEKGERMNHFVARQGDKLMHGLSGNVEVDELRRHIMQLIRIKELGQ